MRSPFSMPGELIITAGQTGIQFPEATFMNNVDKPGEFHRMIPRVVALDDDNIPLTTQPDQELLQSLVRVTVNDLGKNQIITKNPTLMSILTKGTSERSWEWADPYYLVRSESFQVVIDCVNTTFPVITDLAALKIAIDFQGFLCVVAPASNAR